MYIKCIHCTIYALHNILQYTSSNEVTSRVNPYTENTKDIKPIHCTYKHKHMGIMHIYGPVGIAQPTSAILPYHTSFSLLNNNNNIT